MILLYEVGWIDDIYLCIKYNYLSFVSVYGECDIL